MAESKARLVDLRQVRHNSAKMWLWLIWLGIMSISAVYCALSFVAFRELIDLYKEFQASATNKTDNTTLWAILAASLFAPATVVLFFLLGTILLLTKTFTESGMTYSFGAMHISTLWMSILTLQSALSLHAYEDTMKTWINPKVSAEWDSESHRISKAVYIFAYILSVFYFLLFIFLIIFRSAVSELVMKGKKDDKEDKPTETSPLTPEDAAEKGEKAEKTEKEEGEKDAEKKGSKAEAGKAEEGKAEAGKKGDKQDYVV